MTVGNYPAARDMICQRCKHEIRAGKTAYYVKGKRGYWCQGCQDDWVQKNTSGQPSSREQTTTTAAAQDAPRLSSMEQGHRENMESAKMMRNEIALLASSIRALTTALEGLMKMPPKVSP